MCVQTFVTFAALLLFTACSAASSKLVAPCRYAVVNSFPHDTRSFTQGLFLHDGFLYESTGLRGHSSIRKLALKNGHVLQELKLDSRYFAEGIVRVDNKIIQLTYKSKIGFVYDLDTFKLLEQFEYDGEGWGLTYDGRHLIMSDGSAQLIFLDKKHYKPTKKITVRYEGKPLAYINEMEYIEGKIFANVWQTNHIVIIDPKTGDVTGELNLSALEKELGETTDTDVLNGIAWDSQSRHLIVTGKLWPKFFEIKIDGF